VEVVVCEQLGQAEIKHVIRPNLADVDRRKVADLGQLLENPATKDQVLDLLRGLIEARLVPEDGALEVGSGASVLAFWRCAYECKKAGPFRIRLLWVDH
jgi:hypothetical protein